MTRDIQRYLLLAAIAVLSFMLLTEWVHFRQKQAELANQPSAPSATPAQTAKPRPRTVSRIPSDWSC